MPVVAVFGIAAGTSALAGGLAALTVMETIAAVGSIVGGIGALTGNKTLAKIGAIAGLAGGIGAFAESKGWLATANAGETAANAANNTGTIEALKNTASGAEVSVPVDADVSAVASSGTGAVATPVPNPAPMQTSNLEPASAISSNLGQQNAEVTKALGAGPAQGASSAIENAGSIAEATKAPGLMDAASDTMRNLPAHEAVHSLTGREKVLDLFNQFFRDKDGKLDKTMMSLAGNFVGGMFDQNKAAQTELYEERAATERQQRENANAVPAMGFGAQRKPGGPFRPTSPTYRPVRPSGLMNAR